MKKLLIVSAICAVLAGCSKVEDDKNVDNAWTYHGHDCVTKVMDGWYSGSIIHAASCECMNK